MAQENPQYLRPGVVAAMLGLTIQTLREWRQAGKGPPCRMFGRVARFEKTALLAWIDAQPDGSVK